MCFTEIYGEQESTTRWIRNESIFFTARIKSPNTLHFVAKDKELDCFKLMSLKGRETKHYQRSSITLYSIYRFDKSNFLKSIFQNSTKTHHPSITITAHAVNNIMLNLTLRKPERKSASTCMDVHI